MTRLTGMATGEATRAFSARFVADGRALAEFHREAFGLALSSIGHGTYLGEANNETDILYTEAVIASVGRGCNLIDTAVNYRHQRSERSIGRALERLVASGVAREELVIATKAGYVAFDGAAPASPEAFREYLRANFFDAGVCEPRDMCANLQHCLTPGYLDRSLGMSLENLGLESVDVLYLHNPETQLPEVGRAEFERRLRVAFAFLEAKVVEGYIGHYGLATWNGFRVTPDHKSYLSLERVVEIAREAGGDNHHFHVIQLPYNLAMPEAYALFNQAAGTEMVSVLDAARHLGIAVCASASLLQAKLTGEQPDEVCAAFDRPTAAQRALEFARSTPGITSALAGMSRERHVIENMALSGFPMVDAATIAGLFE